MVIRYAKNEYVKLTYKDLRKIIVSPELTTNFKKLRKLGKFWKLGYRSPKSKRLLIAEQEFNKPDVFPIT